jgi:hypothetical protein
MIQVYAPKKRCSHKGTTRILDESVWKDPEPVVREMEAVFEDTYFGGDAYPMWFPNLGPGTLTACLGNPIHFDPEKDTSWQEHSVHDLASWHPHLDKANSIWQATCRLTRRIAEQARDRFVCGISDLGMGIDLLAHVRGPDGLCMDLVECPDVVI